MTATAVIAVEVTDPLCLKNAAEKLCKQFFPTTVTLCKKHHRFFEFDAPSETIHFHGKDKSKSINFAVLVTLQQKATLTQVSNCNLSTHLHKCKIIN